VRIVLLSVIVVCAGVHALSYVYVSSDDAFISLRYARNLAEGHGLRYNPGEPPVEGLSNPLFSTCNAVLIAAGLPPVWAMKLVGWVSFLGAVALLPRLVRAYDSPPRQVWPVMAAALLAASAFPAVWAVAGLETGFHCFLIVLGVVTAVGECQRGSVRWSPVVFCLIAANRPEAAMLGVAVFVVQWCLIPAKRNLLIAWLVGMIVPCAILLGLRYFYYGMLVPNTYTIKALFGSSATRRGGEYLYGFVLSGGYWAAVPAVLGCCTVLARRIREPFVAVPLSIIVCHAVFVVLVGGDFMPGYRFVMPVYPLLCALAASSVVALTQKIPAVPARVPGTCVMAILCVGSYLSQSAGLLNHHRRSWFLHDRSWPTYLTQTDVKGTWLGGHQAVADYVRPRSGPEDLLAVTEAGVMPFFSRLPVLDMLGLNDRTVATLWRGRPGENVPADQATLEVLQRVWAKRLRTVASHILSQDPRWIVLDGQFNSITRKFVPRLDIGKTLIQSVAWRSYRQVFTATVYDARWSETGLIERVNVVFERKGPAVRVPRG